jgi:hypothetical protein
MLHFTGAYIATHRVKRMESPSQAHVIEPVAHVHLVAARARKSATSRPAFSARLRISPAADRPPPMPPGARRARPRSHSYARAHWRTFSGRIRFISGHAVKETFWLCTLTMSALANGVGLCSCSLNAFLPFGERRFDPNCVFHYNFSRKVPRQVVSTWSWSWPRVPIGRAI